MLILRRPQTGCAARAPRRTAENRHAQRLSSPRADCRMRAAVGHQRARADAAYRPGRGSGRARPDARSKLRRAHRPRRFATSCSTSTRSSISSRQLAVSYEWSPDSKALTIKLRPDVTFHDGEKLDAAAVKYSLERHKTMAGSNRRGELAPLAAVDVIDAATATQPDGAFRAAARRAGRSRRHDGLAEGGAGRG